MISQSNGDVTLESMDGGVIAHIAAPWAIDAGQKVVSTYYEVADEGTVLVQVVDHRIGSVVYPAVADPSVRYEPLYWNGTKYADTFVVTGGKNIKDRRKAL